MTKYLALMICSFLLAGPVAAQLTAEQKEEQQERAIGQRAGALLLDAESRAMEQCNTARVVVPLPDLNHVTNAERTVDTILSIEWSGACVDGKRDGDGVLTWIAETTTNTRIDETTKLEIRTVNTQRSEGRFVKGQRLGLWCMTRKSRSTSKTQDFTYPPREFEYSACSIFAGHSRQLTGHYLKQSDGSWMNYVAGRAGGSFLAPGTLEAQSAKVLADAAAGKTIQAPQAPEVQNRALDDLVRGSKITLFLSAAPIALKDKRVAIVLSSNTTIELARFKRERDAFIAASSGLTGAAAQHRTKFIAASNPDRVLVNVAKVVRKYAKTIEPADDLVGLKNGKFDYALVIDWRDETRFDLLGKYDSFPSYPSSEMSNPSRIKIGVTCQLMGGFLINRDLKAVKQLSWAPSCKYKWKDSSETGDLDYMHDLSSSFESRWGKGPDDVGSMMFDLDYVLKN